jgi:bifunctional non-homologous end joining protein LigD
MIPSDLLPMLATPGPLPRGEDWVYEVKWDGFRALVTVENGRTTIRSRRGRDATRDYPEVELAIPDSVVDGELVALVDGRPSFNALQLHSVPVSFVPFDVLHVGGRLVTDLPWYDRRELLEGLLPGVPPVFEDGPLLLTSTRAQGLEGVMAKRRSGRYYPGRRTETWVKVKNVRRQSAVVGGWKPGSGGRTGAIGSLLLGIPGPAGLAYVGHVGTGFSAATLARLQALLAPLVRETSPFTTVPEKGSRWVEPTVVVDVEFQDWTPDGRLRHPSYKGVRDDLAPEDVVRE